MRRGALLVAVVAAMAVGAVADAESDPDVTAGQLAWSADGTFAVVVGDQYTYSDIGGQMSITRTPGTDDFTVAIDTSYTATSTSGLMCTQTISRSFDGTGGFWFGDLQFSGDELWTRRSPNCPELFDLGPTDPAGDSGGENSVTVRLGDDAMTLRFHEFEFELSPVAQEWDTLAEVASSGDDTTGPGDAPAVTGETASAGGESAPPPSTDQVSGTTQPADGAAGAGDGSEQQGIDAADDAADDAVEQDAEQGGDDADDAIGAGAAESEPSGTGVWVLVVAAGATLGGGAALLVRRRRRPGRASAESPVPVPVPVPVPDTGAEADDDDRRVVDLRLTYPVGHSPRVFTTGWLFGAQCIVDPGGPQQRDVSHTVRWSGTAEFTPDVGAQSRPAFTRSGPNTIVLSVDVDGVTHRVETVVEAIDWARYARIGDLARAPADAHGCPACPHAVVGPFTAGSPTVLLDNLPAVRVGDGGIHAVCCAGNQFTAVEGDPSVLIDGKPAVRIGDRTQHCGGYGSVASGAPGAGI